MLSGLIFSGAFCRLGGQVLKCSSLKRLLQAHCLLGSSEWRAVAYSCPQYSSLKRCVCKVHCQGQQKCHFSCALRQAQKPDCPGLCSPRDSAAPCSPLPPTLTAVACYLQLSFPYCRFIPPSVPPVLLTHPWLRWHYPLPEYPSPKWALQFCNFSHIWDHSIKHEQHNLWEPLHVHS